MQKKYGQLNFTDKISNFAAVLNLYNYARFQPDC